MLNANLIRKTLTSTLLIANISVTALAATECLPISAFRTIQASDIKDDGPSDDHKYLHTWYGYFSQTINNDRWVYAIGHSLAPNAAQGLADLKQQLPSVSWTTPPRYIPDLDSCLYKAQDVPGVTTNYIIAMHCSAKNNDCNPDTLSVYKKSL